MSSVSTPEEGRSFAIPLIYNAGKEISTLLMSNSSHSPRNERSQVDDSFSSILTTDSSLLGKNRIVSMKSNASNNAICVARAMLIRKAYHINRIRALRDRRCIRAKMLNDIQSQEQEMKAIQFLQHETYNQESRSQWANVVAMANKKKKEFNEKRDSMFKEFLREKNEKEKHLRRTLIQEKDKIIADACRRKTEMLFDRQERIRDKGKVYRETYKPNSSRERERTYDKMEHDSDLSNSREVRSLEMRKRLEELQKREFFSEKHRKEAEVLDRALKMEEHRRLRLIEKQERSLQSATCRIREDQDLKKRLVAKKLKCADANLLTVRYNRQKMDDIREQKTIEMLESDKLLEQYRHCKKVYADTLRREYADEEDERRRSTARRAAISLRVKRAKMLDAQLSKMEASEQARLRLLDEMRIVGLKDIEK